MKTTQLEPKLTPEAIELLKAIKAANAEIALLSARRNNIEIRCMRLTGLHYPDFEYLYVLAQYKNLI